MFRGVVEVDAFVDGDTGWNSYGAVEVSQEAWFDTFAREKHDEDGVNRSLHSPDITRTSPTPFSQRILPGFDMIPQDVAGEVL